MSGTETTAKMDVYEEVLCGPWFRPRVKGTGRVSPESIALSLKRVEIEEITTALRRMESEGLVVEDSQFSKKNGPYYQAVEGLWRVREDLLHRLGRRHPALLKQQEHKLEHLVLAILMSIPIEDRRHAGLADSPEKTLKELGVYLHKFSEEELEAACSQLESDGLVESHQRVRVGDVAYDCVEPTMGGRLAYEREVCGALGLVERESILDLAVGQRFCVFWAWQNDFKPSRNQISDALEWVTGQINKTDEPRFPVVITRATEPTDGAVHIDLQLLERIQEAAVFVGDVTPVVKYAKRLYPNPNVLIEVGYALASKSADEIVLVEHLRDAADIPGEAEGPLSFPFDIDHFKRLRYSEPKELRAAVEAFLRATLAKKGLL